MPKRRSRKYSVSIDSYLEQINKWYFGQVWWICNMVYEKIILMFLSGFLWRCTWCNLTQLLLLLIYNTDMLFDILNTLENPFFKKFLSITSHHTQARTHTQTHTHCDWFDLLGNLRQICTQYHFIHSMEQNDSNQGWAELFQWNPETFVWKIWYVPPALSHLWQCWGAKH